MNEKRRIVMELLIAKGTTSKGFFEVTDKYLKRVCRLADMIIEATPGGYNDE